MKTTSNNSENANMKMAHKTGVVRAREIRKAGLGIRGIRVGSSYHLEFL